MPVPVIEEFPEIAAWVEDRCGICIVHNLLTGVGHNPGPPAHEPIRCPTLSYEESRQYLAFRSSIGINPAGHTCYRCQVRLVPLLHPPYSTQLDIQRHPFINVGVSVPWAIYRNHALRAQVRAFVEQAQEVTLPAWESPEAFGEWLGSDPNALSPRHYIPYSNSMLLLYFVWLSSM
ncbi:hypothetical protein GGF50DRAFT_108750 [Schizophyllum commune]